MFVEIENYHCPVCQSMDVALIPLSEEKYKYSLEPRGGLQVSFSIFDRKSSNSS
jgi:hypothetical protein